MKIFCSRLKEVRNSLSQNEFAKTLGIPQTSYSRYESGKNEPDYELLVAICRTFGVSADWLLGLTDERVPRGGNPSVTASGVGAVAAGGNMRNVRTAQECQRCAEKDATIATQAETIRMLTDTISKLAANR